MAQTIGFKALKPQCHQILELQNRDREHSFTDAVVRCSNGFFRIHHWILCAGSSLSAPNSIDATSWTVVEISTVLFLFYLEQSRATFCEDRGPQYFKDQLQGRLEALSADTTKVAFLVPWLLHIVRGQERNELLGELSSSLDLKYLRYTKTDAQGKEVGDYLISTDGDTICIIPPAVPALEPLSPSAPAPADIDSLEDGSRIEGVEGENSDASSPTLCRCTCGCSGTRINRERISSPYDSCRVVSQPTQPPASAPTDSSRGVSIIGQPPENLDVPSPTMCSVRIEYETNPPPSVSFSYGNNSNGVADDSSGNPRRRRRSEEEMDSENSPSNLNKRPRRRENRHEEASSSNREKGTLESLENDSENLFSRTCNVHITEPCRITKHRSPIHFRMRLDCCLTRRNQPTNQPPDQPVLSPPLSHSHPSHQGPGHVCKIPSCGRRMTSLTVTELLRHTHEYHALFKLRHYRLRKVPQCLICQSRSTLLHATPEDFTNHVYKCLQSKREELGAEWEPPLQRQKKHYLAFLGSNERWYNQVEDNPTSFTKEEYNQIIQDDSSSEEEDESDDSLLSSPDPQDSAENVSETTSDTDYEDDLCLQIVTEDIAQRVLNSNF